MNAKAHPDLDARVRDLAVSNYRTKGDIVAEAVRELIADGTFAPGAHLRQRELASLLNLSPTPVREGLQKLESEGFVQFDVHRGATVTVLPAERLRDNQRILVVLEALAGELAAAHMTHEHLAVITDLAAQHSRCKDGDAQIRELNRSFHFAIYEMAESPMLVTLLRFLWRSFPMGPQYWRPHAESIAEHALIIEALRSADGQTTARLLSQHVSASMEAVPVVPSTR